MYKAINRDAPRFLFMRIVLIVSLTVTINGMTAQMPAKKVDEKFIDAHKDYKSSLQLDLNPDSTFNYAFHHSIGSCYAKGVWKIHRETISLIRTKNKNHSDSLEMRIFPHFIGQEKWFFRNDTWYLISKSKLTNVTLIRK